MTEALCSEIAQRKNYLPSTQIETIYFGGGTPSLMSESLIEKIVNCIHRHFSIQADAEVTLEANPDDITSEKVKAWRQLSINRLSIGIQSFHDDDLLFMKRAHNAQQAKKSISTSLDYGITNLSIDLIYGTPGMDDLRWISNLETVLSYPVNHISAYALTVEPKTLLSHQIAKNLVTEPDEIQTASQFDILVSKLTANEFEHYEISNFARNGKYAIHNTNYWKNKPYLGIGPSAHSYNGNSRSWNISSNAAYIQGIQAYHPKLETEILTQENKINEYLMTGLRTQWGCMFHDIVNQFGKKEIDRLMPILSGLSSEMEITTDGFKIKTTARIFSDRIAASLFKIV
jgi:oxygen-independent coproporphyrinogen-3 oxidase